MKRVGSMVLALCLLGTLGGCSASGASKSTAPVETAAVTAPAVSAASAYEVTDLLGRSVEIPAGTDSYACIGPGALRLYCYVADDAQLAGVEEVEHSWGEEGRPYNMSIPNVAELPVIGPGGPGNAPDAEMLFSAAPDVIFTCYNSDVSSVDELQEKTGIPVVALSYGEGRIFDESLYDSLSLIGKVTGNEDRAQEVIQYFEDAKADLSKRTENETPERVYLGGQSYRGSHGIESTTGDYEIFEVLHADNVVRDAGIDAYVMLDKEKLIEMDPDVIILDAGGLSLVQEDYAANPEFYDSLSAFSNGNVYLQMPFNYYTTNLEIALSDAYYIGSVLYPDAFGDIDPAAKFDEISNALLGIDSYDKIASEYYGGYQKVVLGE